MQGIILTSPKDIYNSLYGLGLQNQEIRESAQKSAQWLSVLLSLYTWVVEPQDQANPLVGQHTALCHYDYEVLLWHMCVHIQLVCVSVAEAL